MSRDGLASARCSLTAPKWGTCPWQRRPQGGRNVRKPAQPRRNQLPGDEADPSALVLAYQSAELAPRKPKDVGIAKPPALHALRRHLRRTRRDTQAGLHGHHAPRYGPSARMLIHRCATGAQARSRSPRV